MTSMCTVQIECNNCILFCIQNMFKVHFAGRLFAFVLRQERNFFTPGFKIINALSHAFIAPLFIPSQVHKDSAQLNLLSSRYNKSVHVQDSNPTCVTGTPALCHA